MTGTVPIRLDDLANLLTMSAVTDWDPAKHPDLAESWHRAAAIKDAAMAGQPVPQPEPGVPPGEYAMIDGQFMEIAFMGHNELTGYVTEITLGGEPGYHIDLPEKLWGGNPLAWEEYSAKALYSRRPVTEASVRGAWDAAMRRVAERRQQEAEWARQQEQFALAEADLRELPTGDEFAGRGDETAHIESDAPF